MIAQKMAWSKPQKMTQICGIPISPLDSLYNRETLSLRLYYIYIYICTYVYIHICIYIQSYRVHLVRLASTPIFMLAPIPLSCFKS